MLIKRSDIIVDNSWNYRRVLTDIDDLAQSIKSEGLKQAPLVCKRGDKYELTAGFRRMAAIDKLGWTEIDCTIDEKSSELDRRVSNLIENVQRVGTSFGEEAEAIRILFQNGLVEQAIADRIGKSRNWVQERHYYLQMPEPWRKEFDKGWMTSKDLRTSYTLYKIHGEEKLYKMIGKYKDSKERGKPADLGSIAMGRDTKKQRLIPEQKVMQDHLISTLGINHPLVKLLGWTLGYVTDGELDDFLSTYPEYVAREYL